MQNKKTFFICIIMIVAIFFIGKGEVNEYVEECEVNKKIMEELRLEQERLDSMISEDGKASMANTLFIGDSRTVGLWEYGGLDEANYFATVGMTSYSVLTDLVDVPGIGKMTLDELLSTHKYDKIYIMLGINEMGYDFEQTVNKFTEVVKHVDEKQPDAFIFVESNMHVTKKFSDKHKYINNERIDKYNDRIKKLANDKDIFYIDVNTLFDDADGNLDQSKSSDNAHVYAKHYAEWANWLRVETAAKINSLKKN